MQTKNGFVCLRGRREFVAGWFIRWTVNPVSVQGSSPQSDTLKTRTTFPLSSKSITLFAESSVHISPSSTCTAAGTKHRCVV